MPNALLHFAEDAGMIEPRLKSRLVERAYLQEKESQHTLEAAITLREAIYQIFWAIINKKPVPPLALAQIRHWSAFIIRGEHSQLMQKGSRFAWSFDELGGFDVVPKPIMRAPPDLLTSDSTALYSRVFVEELPGGSSSTPAKINASRWCDMKGLR